MYLPVVTMTGCSLGTVAELGSFYAVIAAALSLEQAKPQTSLTILGTGARQALIGRHL